MGIDNTISIDGSAKRPPKPRSARMDVPQQPEKAAEVSEYDEMTTISANGSDDRPPLKGKAPARKAKVELDEDSDDDSVDFDPDEVDGEDVGENAAATDDDEQAEESQDAEDDLSVFDDPYLSLRSQSQAQQTAQAEQIPEVDEKALEAAKETLGADVVDKVLKPLQQKLAASERRVQQAEETARREKYLAQVTREMSKLGVKPERQPAVLARAETVFANAAAAGRPVTPEQALKYAAGKAGAQVDKRQVSGSVKSRQMSPVPSTPRAAPPAKRSFQAGIAAVDAKLKAIGG